MYWKLNLYTIDLDLQVIQFQDDSIQRSDIILNITRLLVILPETFVNVINLVLN